MAELPNPNRRGAATASKEDMMQVSFLKANNFVLESISSNIKSLTDGFSKWMSDWQDALTKAERDRLEALLESKRLNKDKSSGNTNESKMKIPDMSMGMLQFAAIAALVASLTDLDDYINSIKLPGRILAVGKFLGAFGTLLKDTFKMPKFTGMSATADLLKEWFKGGTDKIKNLLKLDSPGFLKFIDDVKLSGVSMFDDLKIGAGKVGKSVKGMLGLDSPGFLKFIGDVKLSGTSMFDDLTKGIANVKSTFKTMVAPVINFGKDAKMAGATMVDDVTKGIANVKSFASDSLTKGLTGAKTTIANIKTFFANIFAPLGDLKAALTLDLEGGVISKALTAIGDFLKPLKTFFSTMWDIVKGPLKIVGALSKTIPFIGQVIAFLMGVFDFFTGFVDGFSEKESTFDEDGNEIKDQRSMLQKTMDGVKQGIFNMFREMLAIPADLIKDGLSWVMGKLGFPGAEEAMDKFSFTKKFDELFSGKFSFSELITKFVMWPGEVYMWILEKILGIFGLKDAAKWVKGFSITDVILAAGTDAETGEFSFTTLLTNFIDSIGEWFSGLLDKAKGLLKSLNPFADKSDSDKQTEIQQKIETLKEERKTAKFSKDESYAEMLPLRAKNKEEIDAEIAELNKESVDLQAKTAADMAALLHAGSTPGSIFVHDEGAHFFAKKTQELMSKTNDSLEKTAEVKIGSSANDNNIIVAPANMGGGGGGAAPDMRGNTTNIVNNSSKSRNIQLKMADNNRPEQLHARRFAAGGPM